MGQLTLFEKTAIDAAKRIIEGGKGWVVDIDLEKFFDRINHDRVLNLVRRKVTDKAMIKLIAMTMESGTPTGSRLGVPQGSPLSPLLSNIVLDELDKELESRGLQFCRYADDCNIYVGSEKAGTRVMESITRYIEKRLKLTVNMTKSRVAIAKAVKFLGVTIYDGMVTIAKKSLKRAFDKVKQLTPRRTHLPIEEQNRRINRWYVGSVAKWIIFFMARHF